MFRESRVYVRVYDTVGMCECVCVCMKSIWLTELFTCCLLRVFFLVLDAKVVLEMRTFDFAERNKTIFRQRFMRLLKMLLINASMQYQRLQESHSALIFLWPMQESHSAGNFLMTPNIRMGYLKTYASICAAPTHSSRWTM